MKKLFKLELSGSQKFVSAYSKEDAQWVAKNSGLSVSSVNEVELRQIVDGGMVNGDYLVAISDMGNLNLSIDGSMPFIMDDEYKNDVSKLTDIKVNASAGGVSFYWTDGEQRVHFGSDFNASYDKKLSWVALVPAL